MMIGFEQVYNHDLGEMFKCYCPTGLHTTPADEFPHGQYHPYWLRRFQTGRYMRQIREIEG